MAKQPIMLLEGNKVQRIYEVSFTLYTEKDETGKPSDRSRCGLVKVKREASGDTTIFRWATDSSKKNFKSGKVTFKNPESEEDMVSLEFEKAFISYYEHHCPDIKHNSGDQIFEYFEISAEKLTLGSDTLHQNWETEETI